MIGSRVGIYEVSAKLGAGAMGEVYRARDTRLGRDVAIKVLPAAFTMDPERLARFEREAKLLASLNHPNIATIHGLEESNGALALVMELVGGESLAARIARGPLPFAEALDLARQIASALDAAHENGVIHRDLKPANILVTEAGVAKVLDFGLAKAVGGEASSGSISGASPTITSAGTAAGIILGTAAYMSPEQARGKAVDRRADVWSFACVLFEMLTGKPAFGGETITDVLAAIVHEEPDWKALPPAARPRLERLLRRCLIKDPRERISDLGDVALMLKEIATEKPETIAAPAPVIEKRSTTMPWLVAAVIGAVALAAGFGMGRGRAVPIAPATTAAATSFQQLTISAGGEGEPSISPDGESFVYVAGDRSAPDIFLQRIGGRKAVNLTADCPKADSEPAFSPDGRQIAYRSECSGGGIFVMGATGESPRKVSDAGYAPTWSPDGHEIAYVTEQVIIPWARSTTSTLWSVDVQTGKKRKVSDHDAVQPAWSPDGKRIAFWGLTGESSSRDLFTVAADGSQSAEAAAVAATNDADLDWSPVWDPSGRGLYFSSTRGGTFNVWRIPMDPGTGRAAGAPVPVTVPSSWAGWISISHDGQRLVYTDRNARTVVRRASLDPATGKIGASVVVPLGTVEVTDDVNLSPDGSLLVFSNAGLPAHLFVVHADGSGLVQLTDGPFRDRQASFSPDGRAVAFQTTRFSNAHLAVVHTDGSGLREIPGSGTSAWFPHWTPDGKRILGGSRDGMFSIAAEGGTSTLLGALSDGRNFWPTSISSDGRSVIGSVFDAAGTTLGIGTIANPEGTFRMVASIKDYVGAVFLPDGKRFVYVDGNRLMLGDVSGGTPREIAAAAPDKFVASVSISQDGRFIAWLEISDESDIWMANLVVQ